jgi:hypothetical protein
MVSRLSGVAAIPPLIPSTIENCTVVRTVGDPDELDFEDTMRRAMPV